MRVLSVFVALVVVSGSRLGAQDVEVEASLDADRIGVEDTLTLTVTVSGASGVAEPKLPTMDGLRVAGVSTSTQMSIVNGRMSSSRSFVYRLLPQREGTFEIGAIEVDAGGSTHRTRPMTVTVVPGSVAPARPRGGSSLDPFSPFRRSRPRDVDENDAFARAELSKSSVFLGEPLVVTYWLYARHVPLGQELEDDPPLTGFWVQDVELGRESTGERRVVEGREYYAFPLMQRVLTPTKTGELTLPPIAFTTAFRLTTGDPWDLFSARASRAITLRTAPSKVEVKPLPSSGRTSAFTGAVGRFELDATIDKSEVEAGDAISLTLSIAGEGSLRAIEPPKRPDLAGFRAFDPKTSDRSRPTEDGLEVEKSWEYVLVPESGGVKELGPWELQFFDPERGEYVTASAGPLSVRVTGGAVADLGRFDDADRRREVTLLREDIRYLKEAPRALGTDRRPYHRSPIFFLTLVAPVLWNLALFLVLRRREKEKTHSHLFRSRRARRMARGRLKRAAALAAEASRGFYEEIAAALYRYVADKVSVSPSGLTSASIDRALEARGVDSETRRELLDVLYRCEEARFTPGVRTREEMAPLRARAEALIVSLERALG